MSQMKINLGGGNRPLKGYTNHDLLPGKNIDLVFDLNDQWPIGSDSVDRYMCLNVFQYIKSPHHFFSEVERTLKSGGYITIEVPHGWSSRAQTDPLSQHLFIPDYFKQFTYDANNDSLPHSFILIKTEEISDRKLNWLQRKMLRLLPFQPLDIYDSIKVTLKKITPVEYEIKKLEEE